MAKASGPLPRQSSGWSDAIRFRCSSIAPMAPAVGTCRAAGAYDVYLRATGLDALTAELRGGGADIQTEVSRFT